MILPCSSRSFPDDPPLFCLINTSELVVVRDVTEEIGLESLLPRRSTPSSILIRPDLGFSSVPSVTDDPCPKSEDVIVLDSWLS